MLRDCLRAGHVGLHDEAVRAQVMNIFSWFRPTCIYIEILFGTSVRVSAFNNARLEEKEK